MPPRFAYWTILIDNKPTAFRAAKREELQPTFAQLKRTNADVTMKWFARGRLWDDPEQAQWAGRNASRPLEKRGRDWRPGGNHRDPRAQFDRRQAKQSVEPRRKRDRPAPPRGSEHRPPPPAASAARPPAAGGTRPPFARKPPRAPWQRDRPPSAAPGRKRRPWTRNPQEGARETNPQPRGAQAPWKAKRPRTGGHRPWKPGAPPDHHRRRRDDDRGNDDK
jgi:hypothetical protein